jgi:hypothetical protein
MSFALLCRDKEVCVVADGGLAVWEFGNTLWFFAAFFFLVLLVGGLVWWSWFCKRVDDGVEWEGLFNACLATSVSVMSSVQTKGVDI